MRFAISDRVHLRLLEESDAEELQTLIERNRAYLGRWLGWAETQSPDDTLGFLRRTRRQFEQDDGFQQAIVCDGGIAGVVGLLGVDWSSRATSIGYWLAEDRQGEGIMTAAVEAVVDYVFGALELSRVELRVATENRRSRAIPERLGFQQEAVFRRAERVSDRHLDMAVYSLLADEWNGPRTD